jgi:tetratricopeptide (TPR) repeat protein
VREDRWGEADTLIRRKFGVVPFGDQVLFADARGDTASLRQLRAQAPEKAAQKGRRTSGLALETGWLLATYLEDLDRAEEFTRFGTAAAITPGLQSSAHQLLANIAVAGGRWSAAKTEFAAAGLVRSDSALVGRALAAALPFLEVPRPDLERIRAEVERWEPGRDVSTPLPESVRPLTGHLRLYLLGLLSARLGDPTTALRNAGELERLGAPADSRTLVGDLGRTLRAEVAAAAGRTKEALSELEVVKGQVPFELIRLPYFSGEPARYLRSLLLHQVGRDEESLRLLEVAFTGTPNELHYRAPMHLLQATIYQRLDQRPAAAEQYSRFLKMWNGCDPALRPVVDGARGELAALTAEPR